MLPASSFEQVSGFEMFDDGAPNVSEQSRVWIGGVQGQRSLLAIYRIDCRGAMGIAAGVGARRPEPRSLRCLRARTRRPTFPPG
jgi:hypothetical protein